MQVLIINGGTEQEFDYAREVSGIIHNTLEELEIDVTIIDLYKEQYNLPAIDLLMDQLDGIILLTTVSWYGMGFRMQKFLDQCYGYNKKIFENQYGLVVSVGENGSVRKAADDLRESFIYLNGLTPEIFTGTFKTVNDIKKQEYFRAIERKAEDFYRLINQKRIYLPFTNYDSELKGYKNFLSDEKLIQNYEELLEEPTTEKDVVDEDILEIANLFKSKLKEHNEKKVD